ncbi:hypothetical protein FGO68_gene6647 [Halteria grandinella]|uniref:Uncharacterized protein n=1 Tax=Halteria grandinella TaxID=5974 RepID=A0A8J8NK35_HALGN|nr:hypothetical protein FGO68_gene6647 [Halteria grandinella]
MFDQQKKDYQYYLFTMGNCFQQTSTSTRHEVNTIQLPIENAPKEDEVQVEESKEDAIIETVKPAEEQPQSMPMRKLEQKKEEAVVIEKRQPRIVINIYGNKQNVQQIQGGKVITVNGKKGVGISIKMGSQITEQRVFTGNQKLVDGADSTPEHIAADTGVVQNDDTSVIAHHHSHHLHHHHQAHEAALHHHHHDNSHNHHHHHHDIAQHQPEVCHDFTAHHDYSAHQNYGGGCGGAAATYDCAPAFSGCGAPAASGCGAVAAGCGGAIGCGGGGGYSGE